MAKENDGWIAVVKTKLQGEKIVRRPDGSEGHAARAPQESGSKQ